MKVAVVGVGGVGSAALRFLAQAGCEAVGFERFRVGHDRGSSHGESRIIRYLYPDPLYTHLMRYAYPLWRDLEARAREELLVSTGGIFIGAPDGVEIAATVDSLKAAGCSYDLLNAAEAASRFPDFRFHSHEAVLSQEDTGFLRASECVRANVRLALQAGAVLHEETIVEDVEELGEGVRVRSSLGEEHFDHVVLTAGPWMGEMLRNLGLPLRVTRQFVAYVGGSAANTASPGRFPAWIDFGSPETFYGIPHDGRISGVKLAMHQFGPEADPNGLPPEMPKAIRQRIEEYAAERFRFESPAVTTTLACLYTTTPDEDFVIERIGGSVTAISGCSGHGFKFTVLLGKIAADLATGGDLDFDLGRFSAARFGH